MAAESRESDDVSNIPPETQEKLGELRDMDLLTVLSSNMKGETNGAIARRIGASTGTVTNRNRVLEERGLMTVQGHGRGTTYHLEEKGARLLALDRMESGGGVPSPPPEEDVSRDLESRNDLSKKEKIIRLLVKEGEIEQSEINRRLDVTAGHTSQVISDLEDTGQAEKIDTGRENRVRLVESVELEEDYLGEEIPAEEALAPSTEELRISQGTPLNHVETDFKTFEDMVEAHRVEEVEHEVEPDEQLGVKQMNRDSQRRHTPFAVDLVEKLESVGGSLEYQEIYSHMNLSHDRTDRAIYLLVQEDAAKLTEEGVELASHQEQEKGAAGALYNSSKSDDTSGRARASGEPTLEPNGGEPASTDLGETGHILAGNRPGLNDEAKEVLEHRADGEIEPGTLEDPAPGIGISRYDQGDKNYSILTDATRHAMEVEDPPEKNWVLYAETGEDVTAGVPRAEPIAYFDDAGELREALEEM